MAWRFQAASRRGKGEGAAWQIALTATDFLANLSSRQQGGAGEAASAAFPLFWDWMELLVPQGNQSENATDDDAD